MSTSAVIKFWRHIIWNTQERRIRSVNGRIFWLNNYARASLKENTLKIYQDARRRLFQEYPDIVSRPLSGLTTLEFEKILLELSSKYAKSTLRHMRILMNQVYKAAKKAGKCVVNPIA